jgi:hypothetical protein
MIQDIQIVQKPLVHHPVNQDKVIYGLSIIKKAVF